MPEKTGRTAGAPRTGAKPRVTPGATTPSLSAPPTSASAPRPDLSVERLEALFALLSNLKRYDVLSVEKLAAHLGVEPTALRHDIELLQYVGVPPLGGGDLLPLEIDEDGYLNVTGEMPGLDRPLRLSSEQTLALVLALQIAGYEPNDALIAKFVGSGAGSAGGAQAGGPGSAGGEQTSGRPADSTGGAQGGGAGSAGGARSDGAALDIARLARMLRVSPSGHDTAVFEAITQALTEGDALKIAYRRADGTRSTRVIEPWLLFAEGEQWYVTAFCHLRGKPQNFRLSRIEAAELTTSSLSPSSAEQAGSTPSPSSAAPAVFAPSLSLRARPQAERGNPGTEATPRQAATPHALEPDGLPLVRLRFEDASLFVASNWPGARVKAQHGGALEIDVPYAGGEWLARQVCAGAGKISVQFPAEVRASVRDYAQQKLKAM